MSLSKKTILSPFVIAGAGNIGDEAMVKGFTFLSAPYHKNYKFYLPAYDLTHARKVEPLINYYRNSRWNIGLRLRAPFAQASLIIGDTPITDVLHPWPINYLCNWVNILRHQPIGFIGVGTEKLLHQESVELVRERIAPLVKIWSTRSIQDKKRLEEYGVSSEKIVPAADLAWLLEPVDKDYGQNQLKALGVDISYPLVGINLTNESFVLEKSPRIFDIVAEFADKLISKYKVSIAFFANDIREVDYVDKTASIRVMKRMKESKRVYVIPNKYYSPQEMFSLISNCTVTLASRYHFCLFSALQAVPFIAIKRQDKLSDLCLDLDWKFCANLIDINTEELEQMFCQINSSYERLSNHLSTCQGFMKERATKNKVVLEALLES